jgi:Uncharacterized protein conserved in bacteria
MLSRIADSMFWLNRYMERSDGLLRSVKTYYILLLDKGVNGNISWHIVLDTFLSHNQDETALLENDTNEALNKLLLDTGNPNSLKVLIQYSRENARGMQDHITKEVWEQVNFMYHQINQLSESGLQGANAIKNINDLSQGCTLFNGVCEATMPRGMGWNFMNLGKFIERCFITINLSRAYFSCINYQLENEKDILFWRPFLLSLSGYELHLKTYHSSNYNHNVLHQAIFNENFPRSILYSLIRIQRYFSHVTESNQSPEKEKLIKSLGWLVSKVKYTDFDSLNHLTLQHFFEDIKKELFVISNSIAQTFFSYS